jgi:hypothetical protein
MSCLILPRRHYSQPSGEVEVDWSNPLTRELVLTSEDTHSGTFTRDAEPIGLARKTSGSSPQSIVYANLPELNDFTLFFVANEVALAVSLVSRAGSTASFPGIDCVLGVGSAGRWVVRYCVTGAASTTSVYAPGLNDGNFHAFAGVRSGTNCLQYADGRYVGLNTGPSGAITHGQALTQGKRATLFQTTSFAMFAVFARALSGDEIVSISANPWQIFKAK